MKLWCCAALLIYGFGTVFFSALTGGQTHDESLYLANGFNFLKTLHIGTNIDHPPFSQWFGSLLPYILGSSDLWLARVPHALLYLFTGGFVAYALYSLKGYSAALLFLIFYAFCPETKAMAALHVTDFDVAAFTLLAAACAYLTDKKRAWPALLCGLFAGFAMTSKITGLISIGLVGLVFVAEKKPLRLFAFVTVGCALALFLAYLGQFGELHHFIESYRYQRYTHNHMGHTTSLFGRVSTTGFWYFYAVSFFFTTPPLFLVLLGTGLVRELNLRDMRSLVLVGISAFLLALLSRANVQLGLRYFLSGMLLLYFWCALSAPALWTWIKPKRKLKLALLTMLCFTALSDANTLAFGSYLSSFNFLAPPPTRNFAESNIDWGQSLPSHLIGKKSYKTPLSFVYDVPGAFEGAPVPTLITPNLLAGIFYPEWRALRSLPVGKVIAGVEEHLMTTKDIFNVIYLVDHFDGTSKRNPLDILEVRTQWVSGKDLTNSHCANSPSKKAFLAVPVEGAPAVRTWLDSNACETQLKQAKMASKAYLVEASLKEPISLSSRH